MKKVICNIVLLIVVWSIKSRIPTKITKRKKPITYLFEVQITIRFLQYLKDIIS